MNPLIPCIWVAGGIHLVIAASNFFAPKELHYQENLSKVSKIVRQIFTIHAVYIVMILFVFSLLCFRFAPELAGGSPLGRFLSGSIAIFWFLRVIVQLFYYDPDVKKQRPLFNLGFLMAFAYLTGVFAIATMGVIR